MDKVTNLAEYRRTHPPALRCLVAMQRAAWKWCELFWWMVGVSRKP